MKFDQNLVKRVATMTKGDVAEMSRIHIPNESVLFSLMAWRDKNKDAVRNFLPLLTEGTISVITPENLQYFNQVGRDTFHMNVTAEQYIAFSHNVDTWQVVEVANTIQFYPKEEAIQDMITVHATVMAYLESIGKMTIGVREIVVINEVAEV